MSQSVQLSLCINHLLKYQGLPLVFVSWKILGCVCGDCFASLRSGFSRTVYCFWPLSSWCVRKQWMKWCTNKSYIELWQWSLIHFQFPLFSHFSLWILDSSHWLWWWKQCYKQKCVHAFCRRNMVRIRFICRPEIVGPLG